jgi:hypothetical protein
MRFIAIVLLLSTTPAHAQSVYLNYGQWVQMPIGLREMYVVGAFDTLSTVAVPAQAIVAKHFNECVARAGLSSGQLTENMQAFAEAQPDLQSKPAAGVLVRYLISLCGTPTQ